MFRHTNNMNTNKTPEEIAAKAAVVALLAIIIFGWLAVVTFFGPELYRAINGPEPVKVTRRHR